MKQVIWSPRAKERLLEIKGYSAANWGEDHAKRYLNALRRGVRDLAEPGVLQRASVEGLYFARIQHHKVVWYETEDTMMILSFVGDRQNWDELFGALVDEYKDKI